jgi:hypothetical protein
MDASKWWVLGGVVAVAAGYFWYHNRTIYGLFLYSGGHAGLVNLNHQDLYSEDPVGKWTIQHYQINPDGSATVNYTPTGGTPSTMVIPAQHITPVK